MPGSRWPSRADATGYSAERAEGLAESLGPLLFRLPTRRGADRLRLDTFLARAPGRLRRVVELRDPGRSTQDIFSARRAHGAALVLHDRIEDRPSKLAAGWT